MKALNFFLIFLLLSSCAREQMDDCFTPLGDVQKITRQLDTFTKIKSTDRIEVVLVQDATRIGEVEIEAPKNLIDQITTAVSNGLLSIENTNTCNFVRSYNYSIILYVYFNELNEITTESASTFTSNDTLHLDALHIYNNALSTSSLILNSREVFVQGKNSSETILSGKVQVLKGTIEEVSNLKAGNLLAEEVLVDSHTPYDCYINALKGIYVNIYNSGNIIYVQEPTDYKLTGVKIGTGNLVKK